MKTPSANQITVAYLDNLAAVLAVVAEATRRLAACAADGDYTPAEAVAILNENLRTLETAAEFVGCEPEVDQDCKTCQGTGFVAPSKTLPCPHCAPVKGSAAPTLPRECDGKGTRTGAAVITRAHRSLMRNASEGGLQ